MDRGGLQKSIRVICKNGGINKHIYVHSLRHCYGAHFVESGLNLRTIQHEMGHECPKTTALYIQLTDVIINRMIKRLNIHLKQKHGITEHSKAKILWLWFCNTLPKGFRRARDYGFLHGNAKKLLTLIQTVLKARLPMNIIAFSKNKRLVLSGS
jgi:hypothetical protein